MPRWELSKSERAKTRRVIIGKIHIPPIASLRFGHWRSWQLFRSSELKKERAAPQQRKTDAKTWKSWNCPSGQRMNYLQETNFSIFSVWFSTKKLKNQQRFCFGMHPQVFPKTKTSKKSSGPTVKKVYRCQWKKRQIINTVSAKWQIKNMPNYWSNDEASRQKPAAHDTYPASVTSPPQSQMRQLLVCSRGSILLSFFSHAFEGNAVGAEGPCEPGAQPFRGKGFGFISLAF